jgi:6-phosphogluconate dehydrogenase
MATGTNSCDIGLIGLAVMGENLVLNMESKGFTVGVFNRTTAVTEKFAAGRAAGKHIVPSTTLEDFVASLKRPRKAMIMVKAGAPVDAVIDQLAPLLEPGDLLIDGGNSLFTDTQRRCGQLAAKGLHYLGTGVSGGEEGALKGPSLMPGGPQDAWEIIAPIFTKIAAQVEGEACCRYMGTDGAGHYVKMVHNGIEYGDMQLICEAYAILKDVLKLSAEEMHDVFVQWNSGDLDSFLIDITSRIFTVKDPATGQLLVDVILDKAGQKGTGKWTIMSALDLGVVVSTINAAVEARVTSSMKTQRVAAAKILSGPPSPDFTGDRQGLIDAVRDALYASKIVSYAQGMDLLGAAGRAFKWDLHFGDIATIWRGGCIIRARFLNRIKEAYEREPGLSNLMLDSYFTAALARTQPNWRHAVTTATQWGVAVPAFSASLAYFDSYRQERLPANLLQAQRDFFGAHTYERIDQPGVFHTEWLQEVNMV